MKVNKGRKSFLAMLLALAMTLSMIPATAFAEVKGNVQADASKTVSVTPVDSLSTGEKYIIATKDEESGTYYALSTLASDQKDGTGTNAHYLIGYAIAMTAVTGANSVITGFTVDENDANNLFWDCSNTGTGSGYSSARMKGVNKNKTSENELYVSSDIKYQSGRDIRYANNEMYGYSSSSGSYYVYLDKAGLTTNELCFKTTKSTDDPHAKIYFFKYNAPEYTVSFNVGTQIEADTPKPQTVKEGNKATKPANPVDPAGKYVFATWCSDSGLTTPYDFDTAVTTSIQLYAKWEEATAFEKVDSLSEEDDGSRYLITATSGDKVYALSKESSGTSLGTAVEVTPDDNDTIKAAASSLAWTYFNISSSSYFVNADLASTNVLYLGNGALRYNGTYNNGAVTGATAVNYTEAQKMQNASSTTRYVGISESPAAFTCVTSNSGNSAPVITLYKEVVASDTFKVTYDSNGGSGTVTDDNAYAPKATVTVKDGAGTKTGYTFAGWKAGDNVYQPNATFQITQNTKLTAQWTANTYTVQFDKGEAGATGTMGNQTFTYDAAQNLNENKFSYEGYAFEGWKNGNSTELISDKASVKNLTAENNGTVKLTAQWKKVTNKKFVQIDPSEKLKGDTTYIITVKDGDKFYALDKSNLNRNSTESVGKEISLTGTGELTTSDENIQFLSKAYNNNIFLISEEVSDGGDIDANKYGNMLYVGSSDIKLKGVWTGSSYISGSGPRQLTYSDSKLYATEPDTTASPKYVTFDTSSHKFDGSSTKGDAATIILFKETKDEPATYNVTYNSNGGSGAVTDDNAYAPNATVTVKGAPGTKTGYTFAGWKAGDNVYQPNGTFQITKDTTLTAQWTANTYKVQFDKGEDDATGTMGDQTFTYDTAQNLNENKFSYEGYSFTGWKNGNSTELISDKQSVKNLTAENNGTVKLTAQWKQNDPPAEDVTISVKPVNSFAEDGSSVGEYIIAAKDAEGNYYALSKKTVSNRIDNTTYTSYGFAEKVTVNNNTVKVASDVADNLKWTCTFKTSDNLYYFWTDSTTSQRLYLSSQGKGGLKTGSADREIRYADNKMYTKASSGLNYVIFNETADALGLQFTGVDTAEGETPAATYNSTIYLFKISEDQPGDDAAAAEAVEALIDALPAAADVTLDNKAAIEAAQEAFNDLTPEQKALVDETKLAKLTDVVEALATAQAAADAEAANTVKGLIDALPAAADVTLDDQTAIEAARAAYNALSEAQKDLIDNTVLQKLTDAEAALDALQDTNVINVTQVDTLTQGKYIIVAKTVEDNKDVYHALSKDVKNVDSYTSFGVAKTVDATVNGGAITKLTVDKDLVDNLTWVCTTNNSDTYLWTADVGASNRHSMYISGSDKGGIKYQSDDRPVYFEDGENLYGLNSDKNKKYYVYYDAQAENDLQFTTVASQGLDDKPGAEYNATIYLLKVVDDSEIAGAVTDQLNDLPVAANVTLDDKAAIEAARDAYNNLTPAQKALINEDTLKKLTDAEEALAALEKAAADAAKAKTVSDAINALPSAAYVQASDKADIEAARKAYDDLTADQKKLVDDSTLKKLTDAEAALAAVEKAEQDTAKAKAAADAINALPSATNVKASDKAAIEAARKAYDDLTPDQKKLINEGTLKKLTDAEAALKALDGNTPKDDTAATKSAKAVTDQINALPANITLSNKDAVAAARKAYNALSAEAKAKVSSATLAKLTKAEQTIKDLQEYDAAVNAAKKIKAKLKSVKAQKGRKALVKWKKVKDVSGYEIRYSTKKSFKKGVKKAKVKKGTTTKKTIKKLKAGKTYYVQIRTIKKVPNKATGTTTLVYGKWSNKKKVKAKN